MADNTAPVHGNREVKIEFESKPRRNTHGHVVLETGGRGISKVSSKSLDYVYVNNAFVGSVNNVAPEVIRAHEPPTSVIREQYWACSKWSQSQKVLALAVGVLLGTVIGLSISYALKITPDDVIGGIIRGDSRSAVE